MAIDFMTADGLRTVRHWGYRLQGSGKGRKSHKLPIGELKLAQHDLIVVDFSKDGSDAGAFTPEQIASLKSRKKANSVVVSYISIGEASDYRDHWQDDWTTYTDKDQRAAGPPSDKAPAWLGAWNEDWPNSRKVRYWDTDWQALIFNEARTGWLDRIVAAGFDGAYLDIVDGYYHWGVEAVKSDAFREGDPKSEREAAARMIDFISALSRHAREINPEFLVIPQNGAFIIDALEDEDHPRRDAYFKAISAIACEDLFFRGDDAENNPFDPDQETIDTLVATFIDSGTPVLSVDYIDKPGKITEFYQAATGNGFLPYAAPERELNRMGAPYDGSADAVA
jgi:cysteinyl-tRNA synthetase, unknown class